MRVARNLAFLTFILSMAVAASTNRVFAMTTWGDWIGWAEQSCETYDYDDEDPMILTLSCQCSTSSECDNFVQSACTTFEAACVDYCENDYGTCMDVASQCGGGSFGLDAECRCHPINWPDCPTP